MWSFFLKPGISQKTCTNLMKTRPYRRYEKNQAMRLALYWFTQKSGSLPFVYVGANSDSSHCILPRCFENYYKQICVKTIRKPCLLDLRAFCDFCWMFAGRFGLVFPTCQVRVVRFYQSCSPPPSPPHPPPPPRPPPPPPSPDPSGHCRTSTATSRSQWALPDLNRDFQIAVGTAGPQPRLPDPSGHCRASTAR